MDRLHRAAWWFWVCGGSAGAVGWMADLYLRLPLIAGAAVLGAATAWVLPRNRAIIVLLVGILGGFVLEFQLVWRLFAAFPVIWPFDTNA